MNLEAKKKSLLSVLNSSSKLVVWWVSLFTLVTLGPSSLLHAGSLSFISKYSTCYQLSDLITQVLCSQSSWVGKQEVLKQVVLRQVPFPKAIFCQIMGWGHATECLAYSLFFKKLWKCLLCNISWRIKIRGRKIKIYPAVVYINQTRSDRLPSLIMFLMM